MSARSGRSSNTIKWTVSPLTSVVLWRISGTGIYIIESPSPVPTRKTWRATVNNWSTSSSALHLQLGPWWCILITLFPNTCSLPCPMMSFVLWLDLDLVLTLFAVKQPLGIAGLPWVATILRQTILFRMGNKWHAIFHAHTQVISTQEIYPPLISNRISM